jgi:hypothetical protein
MVRQNVAEQRCYLSSIDRARTASTGYSNWFLIPSIANAAAKNASVSPETKYCNYDRVPNPYDVLRLRRHDFRQQPEEAQILDSVSGLSTFLAGTARNGR